MNYNDGINCDNSGKLFYNLEEINEFFTKRNTNIKFIKLVED